MVLKYDREFAACSRAEEHCELRLPLQPPVPAVNCHAASPGPFKIDKSTDRHWF